MMRVGATAEVYGNRIHVDPCCPSVRTVVSDAAPKVNDLVCQSGMTSRAICSLRVVSLTGEFCDDAGCTPGLVVFQRSGDVVVRPGDSGGPLYARSGTSNAAARGLVIALSDFGTTGYAENIANVEAHLGVAVAH